LPPTTASSCSWPWSSSVGWLLRTTISARCTATPIRRLSYMRTFAGPPARRGGPCFPESNEDSGSGSREPFSPLSPEYRGEGGKSEVPSHGEVLHRVKRVAPSVHCGAADLLQRLGPQPGPNQHLAQRARHLP